MPAQHPKAIIRAADEYSSVKLRGATGTMRARNKTKADLLKEIDELQSEVADVKRLLS